MENIFILDPSATYLDIVDSIDRKLEQTKCITDSIAIGGFDESGTETIFGARVFLGALWAISENLEDLKRLSRNLHNLHNHMNSRNTFKHETNFENVKTEVLH